MSPDCMCQENLCVGAAQALHHPHEGLPSQRESLGQINRKGQNEGAKIEDTVTNHERKSTHVS